MSQELTTMQDKFPRLGPGGLERIDPKQLYIMASFAQIKTQDGRAICPAIYKGRLDGYIPFIVSMTSIVVIGEDIIKFFKSREDLWHQTKLFSTWFHAHNRDDLVKELGIMVRAKQNFEQLAGIYRKRLEDGGTGECLQCKIKQREVDDLKDRKIVSDTADKEVDKMVDGLREELTTKDNVIKLLKKQLYKVGTEFEEHKKRYTVFGDPKPTERAELIDGDTFILMMENAVKKGIGDLNILSAIGTKLESMRTYGRGKFKFRGEEVTVSSNGHKLNFSVAGALPLKLQLGSPHVPEYLPPKQNKVLEEKITKDEPCLVMNMEDVEALLKEIPKKKYRKIINEGMRNFWF